MHALVELIPTYCVALVAIVALLARLGAPIPVGPLLLIVGGLAGHPGVSVVAAFLASIVGSTLGDAVWFAAGRRYGISTLILLCKISQTPDVCVSQNESIFSKWGGSSLMAAKFLPGISLVAPPMASALGMTLSRFLPYEAAGSAIYSGSFLVLGYLFRAQVQAALAVLSAFGSAAVGGLTLSVAAYAYIRYRRWLLAARTADVARISISELRTLQATPNPPLLVTYAQASGTCWTASRSPEPCTLPSPNCETKRARSHAIVRSSFTAVASARPRQYAHAGCS